MVDQGSPGCNTCQLAVGTQQKQGLDCLCVSESPTLNSGLVSKAPSKTFTRPTGDPNEVVACTAPEFCCSPSKTFHNCSTWGPCEQILDVIDANMDFFSRNGIRVVIEVLQFLPKRVG